MKNAQETRDIILQFDKDASIDPVVSTVAQHARRLPLGNVCLVPFQIDDVFFKVLRDDKANSSTPETNLKPAYNLIKDSPASHRWVLVDELSAGRSTSMGATPSWILETIYDYYTHAKVLKIETNPTRAISYRIAFQRGVEMGLPVLEVQTYGNVVYTFRPMVQDNQRFYKLFKLIIDEETGQTLEYFHCGAVVQAHFNSPLDGQQPDALLVDSKLVDEELALLMYFTVRRYTKFTSMWPVWWKPARIPKICHKLTTMDGAYLISEQQWPIPTIDEASPKRNRDDPNSRIHAPQILANEEIEVVPTSTSTDQPRPQPQPQPQSQSQSGSGSGAESTSSSESTHDLRDSHIMEMRKAKIKEIFVQKQAVEMAYYGHKHLPCKQSSTMTPRSSMASKSLSVSPPKAPPPSLSGASALTTTDESVNPQHVQPARMIDAPPSRGTKKLHTYPATPIIPRFDCCADAVYLGVVNAAYLSRYTLSDHAVSNMRQNSRFSIQKQLETSTKDDE